MNTIIPRNLAWASVISISLLVGCAGGGAETGQPKPLEQFIAGMKSALPGAAHPFDGIFTPASDGAWPRVALTVTRIPTDAYGPALLFKDNRIPMNYCLRASAVVWKSATEKREIPETDFCGSQANARRSFDSADWLMWSMSVNQAKNTGRSRTLGPLPPEKNFPEGNRHGQFPLSKGASLLAFLIQRMGHDITINPMQDHRLWIVSYPPEN